MRALLLVGYAPAIRFFVGGVGIGVGLSLGVAGATAWVAVAERRKWRKVAAALHSAAESITRDGAK